MLFQKIIRLVFIKLRIQKVNHLKLDLKLNSLIKDMNYYVTLKGINIGAFF